MGPKTLIAVEVERWLVRMTHLEPWTAKQSLGSSPNPIALIRFLSSGRIPGRITSTSGCESAGKPLPIGCTSRVVRHVPRKDFQFFLVRLFFFFFQVICPVNLELLCYFLYHIHFIHETHLSHLFRLQYILLGSADPLYSVI